jgi:hypothetical protein
MAITNFPGGPSEGENPMAASSMMNMFGPHAADQLVRQCITQIWMLLPDGKKSVDLVEKELRRLVDRAIKDLKEDASVFLRP